jgi:hypothetical protein
VRTYDESFASNHRAHGAKPRPEQSFQQATLAG